MPKESSEDIRKRCLSPRSRIEWQFKGVNIQYDDTWREIFREVGNELKMPREDVERINTAWWRYVSEMMSNPLLPCIRILFLGTLRPSVKMLARYCERMGRMIQKLYRGEYPLRGQRVGDVKKMDDHLLALRGTYERLGEEAQAHREKVKLRRLAREAAENGVVK